MIWLAEFVDWLKSLTGWKVYPNLLPDGVNQGIVYEAEEEADHDHSDRGRYGPVNLTLFFFAKRLQTAAAKADLVVQNLADIATPAGYLRGGQVVSRETGQEPVSGLRFVMLRIHFMHQEV